LALEGAHAHLLRFALRARCDEVDYTRLHTKCNTRLNIFC
jgi:hypothetical protein